MEHTCIVVNTFKKESFENWTQSAPLGALGELWCLGHRLLTDSAPEYCHQAQQITHFNAPVLPMTGSEFWDPHPAHKQSLLRRQGKEGLKWGLSSWDDDLGQGEQKRTNIDSLYCLPVIVWGAWHSLSVSSSWQFYREVAYSFHGCSWGSHMLQQHLR